MNTYAGRKYIIAAIIILIGLIFVIRLFSLQVLDSSYKFSADSNTRRTKILYPARGLIYDRNGEILVYNEAAYDLMVNPSQLHVFDTLDFCEILNITPEEVVNRIREASNYSMYRPSIFMKQISSVTYAVLQEKMYKFPGFFVQPRTLRNYPRKIAAHFLGYVGEVDEKTIKEDPYYQPGDYIGISGIEKSYENILRGEKGRKIVLVDVYNREMGSYQGGWYDEPLVVGKDIVSTLDAGLQEYGEYLMQKFRGSIVALEPSTGQVLSLVTRPNYSPDLLVGRARGDHYKILSEDTLKPLFNRALMAQYPPGSTFKTVNGLIALQEGVIRTSTEFECHMGYYFENISVGCHMHESPLDFIHALQNSCNSYFMNVFRRILIDPKFNSTEEAYTNWKNHVISFGFGDLLGTDMLNELKGYIPDSGYYNGIYGKGHWNFLTVRSLAIGQGELGITPLQMANLAAIIANRGYYYVPHVVKEIKGEESIDEKFLVRHYVSIDSIHFERVVDGMDLAVNGGSGSTAWRARMTGMIVCGKTGTAENPHGEDHSIFIAFAPKENPQIAVSVYVENGGFGNIWGAPIASLMIEKYLNDTISRPYLEDYVLQGISPVQSNP
jgi:penicillin-binding protein 2